MKIALPTRGTQVDDHFGHCEKYTIVTINEKKEIAGSEIIPSPQGCGCKSNIASILREKGVTVLLAGNMGEGALNVLSNHGIKVIRGCSGDVLSVVAAYLSGNTSDSGTSCAHHNHEHGHTCEH